MRQSVRIASDFIGIVIDIIASHSLFFHLLNWNIVYLQCCVSFRYITSWFSLCIYDCVCAPLLSVIWLCDPMSCNMPGSSVHGIFQARILEWVAISSSRISSWPKDQTHVSCISSTSRWILHHWATWEASLYTHTHIFRFFSVFTSVQLLSRVRLCVTPWTARQASLSITNSRSLLKLMSIESVMPSNHLILCHPLLPAPSFFPSIRVFSNELLPCIR